MSSHRKMMCGICRGIAALHFGLKGVGVSGAPRRWGHRGFACALFLLFAFLLTCSAKADDYAYAVTNTLQFGQLDLTTGAFTQVGFTNAILGGLAAHGGKLYGGALGSGTLYQINPTSGSVTFVGTGSITYLSFGSTTTGLYAVGQDSNLYSINPTNGAATLIGPTGLTGICAAGLSSGSTTLYLSAGLLCSSFASTLYSLNTATGAATAIGSIGTGTGSPPMLFDNGTLFAGVNFPTQQVCSLDVLTGTPTCTASVIGTTGSLYGLALPNPVPLINQPLVPASAAPGGAGFTLTVNGTGFVSNATVDWNGSPLTTTFVSSNQLTATVPAGDIAFLGTALVTVANPTLGGGVSNVVFFPVTNSSASLTYANATGSPVTVGTNPISVAVGDFNGDGKLDMAVANQLSNNVTILLGNGNGTFTQAVGSPIITGLNPLSVAAGDFNGDGKLDLAVATCGTDSTCTTPGAVTILLGNGDGTFTPVASSPATGLQPESIAVGDFNGDGKLDLVVADFGACSGDLNILLGNGDGTFTAPASQPSTYGCNPISVVVGDFNGDGILDFATADYGDNTASILLGNGDGTFTLAPSTPSTGTLPASLATGDFNGDGKLDLAVANQSDGTLSILLGNGDGTFATASTVSAGTSPTSVAIGDFNGDGKLDLAVTDASEVSSNLTILLGNGDGTFTANPTAPATGSFPYSVAVGDFNGDGSLDLATANRNSGSVSVLLQTLAGINLSSTSLSFGDQIISTTSAAQTVTITNTGTANLIFTGITPSGDFAIAGSGTTCSIDIQVLPSATCTLNITFTPTAFGTRTGSISIADNAAGSPQGISLTGIGISAAVVGFSAPSLTFGNQVVGTTSTAQTLTMTNSGAGTLGSISITASAGFAETDNCGTSLAIGLSCTINVSFSPTFAGATFGTISVSDDAAGSPQLVSLSGTGIAPSIIFNPEALEFTQSVGSASAPQTVILTNIGTAALTISSIVATAPFAETNTCGSSVAIGATCTITVTFTPAAVGSASGTVTVNANPTQGSASLGVTGTGYVLRLTPSTLSFVAQPLGTTSPAETVTLLNTGAAPVSITGVSISGTDAGDFAQANTCGSSIAAGGTCTISITFAPTAVGPRGGPPFSSSPTSLTVSTGSALEATLSTTVFGTGIVMQFSPQAFSGESYSESGTVVGMLFDNQGIGTTSAGQTTTLTNTGSSPVSITSIAANAPFTEPNTCGTSLAAGASCTITVAFSPTFAGSAVGSLTVTSSAPDSPQSVQLLGVGETLQQSTRLLFFGQQATGTTSSAQIVTLTNTGAGPVDVSGFATTGDFAQTNTCGTSIAAGTNCTVSVTFTPTVAGPRSGNLSISSIAAGNLSVALFGNSPIVNAPGFMTNVFGPNDDDYTPMVPLPFTANFFGNQYNGLFVNNNGNVTFDTGLSTFTPFDLTSTGTVIIAPFFADVYTADWPGSGLVTYGTDTVNGHTAFGVNFFNVAYFAADDKLNTFQLILIDRSDVAAGDFDIEFNYGKIEWETGDASGGSDGLGGSSARVGYSNGTGQPNTFFELPGSAVNGGLLDSNPTTGLINNSLGSPLLGQYVFQVRSGAVVPPGLALSSTNLTFPSTTQGQASSPMTLTLSNTGGSSLTVSNVAATGDFSQTNTCTSALSPGGTCTVNVTFTPTAAGTRTGTLTITSNAPTSPQTVTLSGTGIAVAAVGLSATNVTFGSQTVGTTSNLQTITLTNSGTGALTITALAASPSDFAIALPNTPGATACQLLIGSPLAAGSSCRIPVVFTPSTTGSITGTLTITDNASTSPQIVTLSGTGALSAAAVTLSATSVQSPDTHLNTICQPRVVTMTNSGTGPLTILSIQTTGPFTQTNTCGTLLAVGANCAISVVFVPTVTGPQTGTLTFADNAAGSPQTVALAGNGLSPCLSVTPAVANVARGADVAAFGIAHSVPCSGESSLSLTCSNASPARCVFNPATVSPTVTSALSVEGLKEMTASALSFQVHGDAATVHGTLSLLVLISDFLFTPATPPGGATVTAGQTATYQMGVEPLNLFKGAVTFACSGTPSGSTCTVSPQSVTLDGRTTRPVTVTVGTTARSETLPNGPGGGIKLPGGGSLALKWWTLAWLLAGLLVIAAKRKASARRARWLSGMVLAMVLAWAACGGGGGPLVTSNGGTPAGTYNIVVTGSYSGGAGTAGNPGPDTSGTLKHSTTLPLTVN